MPQMEAPVLRSLLGEEGLAKADPLRLFLLKNVRAICANFYPVSRGMFIRFVGVQALACRSRLPLKQFPR